MKIHSIKTYVSISLIIAFLLSLSPIILLLEHNSWFDILDKVIIVIIAFIIAFFNLYFINYIFSQSYSYYKKFLLFILFNVFILGFSFLIKALYWYSIPFHKPPFVLYIGIEMIRNGIIVLVSFWVITFLNKKSEQIENQIQLRELENQNLQLQLKNLTAQLQPHFFFNSLNVLAEFIHIDVQKSDQYIQHLSHIFRYVLTSQDTTFVALQSEINFIKSYLFLLKIRFDEEIIISYDVKEEDRFTVPSLCTLVVLENIVKHNNISNIQIKISNDFESLSISNSKNKKRNKEVDSLGYGLANIDKKCKLLLNSGIIIHETETIFEVKIPLKKIN